jgi:hypothetical protein
MKITHILTTVLNGVRKIPVMIGVAAAIFLRYDAMAGPIMVDLGTVGA